MALNGTPCESQSDMTSSPTSPLPQHHHAFHSLIPDCKRLIFHYHTIHITNGTRFDPLSASDIAFLRCYAYSWQFDHRVDILPYLQHTRGRKLKLFHVKASGSNSSLTNEAFQYFRGIHSLDVSRSFYAPYTEKAIVNLRGIQVLNCESCTQFTDETLENVRGVKELDISGINHLTNAAFVHLRGVKLLTMQRLTQITSEAFENLRGVEALDISGCYTLDDSVFEQIRGVKALIMDSYYTDERIEITDEAFRNLRGVESLSMCLCSQKITNEALRNLVGIKELIMDQCTQFTKECLRYVCGARVFHCPLILSMEADDYRNLRGIERLYFTKDQNLPKYSYENFRACRAIDLTGMKSLKDEDLANFVGAELLVLDNCPNITNQALRYLCNVKDLSLSGSGIHIELQDVEYVKRMLRNVKILTLGFDNADWNVRRVLRDAGIFVQ